MLRAWPRAAIGAAVAGVAVAAQLAVIVPAEAAWPKIIISATSRFKPVTGDVFVQYHSTAYGSAKLHGTITGGAAGEVAALYGQPFPYQKAAARVGSITLKATSTTYSFTVQPSLATRYTVKLFATGATTAPVATSPTRNLYVVNAQTIGASQKCTRPVCHETYHINTFVPPSTLHAELAKHLYPYFGLTLGSSKVPAPPKSLNLNGGQASVTTSRRISAGEFTNTLKFSFSIGNHSYYYIPAFCTKDTVTSDGLGLPGRHSCGAGKISTTVAYLG